MSKVTKISGLFFVAMLLFLSISTENYSLSLTSQLQSSQPNSSDSYFSTEKPDLFLLNRQEQRLAYSVKNLPVASIKNHPNNFHGNCLSPEVRISGIDSGYLSYSVTLYRNFTSHDIIFPFHYFW
jgi:hypothetical protein